LGVEYGLMPPLEPVFDVVVALGVLELLDEPHPAASTSAQQRARAEKPRLMGGDPFSASSRVRTIAHPQVRRRVYRSSLHLLHSTASMSPRHFLTGAELTASELNALLDRALELKAAPLSSRRSPGEASR